ncbi:MAG: hypothetical protein GX654_20305 [Desulfatiglans sp.]|nr:hypothetical protein [Desulfatiglans sp.]
MKKIEGDNMVTPQVKIIIEDINREIKKAVKVLIDLSGSWDDTRSAEDIIMDIKSNRKNSKKLEQI